MPTSFLAPRLGTAATAWIANLSESEIEARMGGEFIDHSREQLEALTSAMVAIQEAGPESWSQKSALFAPDADTGTSLANAIRLKCGGNVPDAAVKSDAVIAPLVLIARDLFAACLPAGNGGYAQIDGMTLHYATAQHPKHAEFLAAVEVDADLGALIPASKEFVKLRFSDHGGGTLRPGELLSRLLSTASVRVAATGTGLTPEALFAQLEADVDELRALLQGKTRATQVIVSLSGVALPADTVVDLRELGKARPMLPHERGTGLSDRELQPTTALIRSLDLTAVVEEVDDAQHITVMRSLDADPDFEAGRQASFTAVLAATRDARFAPFPAWISVVRPLDGTPGSSYRRGVIDPGEPYELTKEEATSWEQWTSSFLSSHSSSLDISVRRLLSALHRGSPEDSLIDAVVVWENVIAADTEVTFRVSGGLAVLLEQDPAKRDDLRRRLRDIYTHRSRLVHGSEPPRKADLVKDAEEARTVATKALRKLYGECPELISLKDRGTQLLLGAAP